MMTIHITGMLMCLKILPNEIILSIFKKYVD